MTDIHEFETNENDPPTEPGLISLHYLRSALRRRRRMILGASLIAMLVGASVPFLLPPQSTAVTTLLLQHPDGVDPAQAMATDASMLNTRRVAQLSVDKLGVHEDVTAFAKSVTGQVVTDQILTITVAGTSPEDAMDRANVVASVFLGFRADQFKAQEQAVKAAQQQEINSLQTRINALTAQITRSGLHSASASETSDLINQRSQASDQLIQLQQTQQQSRVANAGVIDASHVIDSAVPVPTHVKRSMLVDALIGGVGVACALSLWTVVAASVSDRVRRRSDIAYLVGAPVRVSLHRISRAGRTVGPTLRGEAQPRTPDLERFVVELRTVLHDEPGFSRSLAVVAVQESHEIAAAVALLAARIRAAGKRVLVVELTETGSLARLAGLKGAGECEFSDPRSGGSVAILRPADWNLPAYAAAEAAAAPAADVTICLATLSPERGADHLAAWASDAVLAVTAGASSVERINATAEMIRAAGLQLLFAALFRSDPLDESLGYEPELTPRPVVRPSFAADVT